MKKHLFIKLSLLLFLVIWNTYAWADNAGMYQGDLTYSYNGTTYTVTSGTTSTDLSTPLNATLKVTKVKFYFWYYYNDYSKYGNVCGGLLGYNLTGGDCSSEYLMGSEASWNDDGWVSDSRHKQITITRDMTIASPTSASGNYTFNYYFKGWGDNDDKDNCGDNWYLSNDSKNYALNYKVRPPEVNGGDFTITSTDSQGGTGADSDHPMLITNGLSTTTFTVTASKAHADANSLLWVSFDNGANWSTGANATATTVTSGSKSVSSDVSSFTVKVKFRNNGASLESATTVSKTFYYKEQPAGITVNAGSNGTVSKDNSNWSTSASIEGISLNTWYDIYAQGNTHYDFSSWSKGTNSSNITLEGSTAHTRIKIASGAVSSVTANFVEHPYTINIVNGTAASTTAKIATYGQATKSEPNGKYFTGWSVPGSNFTLTGGTKTSDATIKFFATANGTVTANMTPIWYLKGAFNDWGTTHPFVFTSATSGYVDVELSANSNFKVYDAQHSQMYGSQYGIENGTRLSTTLWSDNDNVCPINIQSIAGTYRFTLDISGTYPVITVTLPVVNQVRISAATPSDATNTGNFNLTDQGSNNWSVQRRLNANTTYTFKIVSATTWYGKNSTAITRDNASASSLSTSGANMTVRTDAAGNYTFNFNSSSKNLSVSYPTIYAITLKTKSFYNESATGTVDSNGGTVSAVDNYGATIADGGKVQTGGTVTFTATPKTGYTFAGWYNDADCAEGHKYVDNNTTINISGENDEVLELSSITAAKTVYAKFVEKMTTVSLYTIGNGHIEISSSTVTSAKVGKHTTYSVVAVPDAGHYFTGWTKSSGTDYTISSTSSATTTLSGNGGGSTSGQMLTANFARRWVIAGEWAKDGSGNWVITNDMTYNSLGEYVYRQITGLAANTSYDFKLYDRTGDTHWVGYASSGQVYDYETYDASAPDDSILVNSYPGNNISLKTAAQGDYTFRYNINTHKLIISFPASRKVEMGIYTQSDGVSSVHEGGSISAVDNSSNVITNGLYIASGANITFNATPKAGYIWRGWYDNAYGYGEPVATEREHTDVGVTSVAFRRYAFFEEALYTVKVHRNDVIETTVKVGVDTHPTIMASTAPTGKIFDRWVTTGSATVADPYSSTTTITGATDDVSTVTATFKDLPKIYIDLTSATDWRPSNMYAYFYKGSCWDGGNGASATSNIIAGQYAMTKIDNTNIWYCEYDPTAGDFAGKTITGVAFSDQSQNSGTFWNSTVTYRNDFSSCMNMFVVTDNSHTDYNNHSCAYRNTNAIAGDAAKGYWRKYGENNSGFYINNLPGGSVEFTNEDGGNTYTARVNLDANTPYHFYLGGCNGWNWSNDKTSYYFDSDHRTRNVQPYDNVSSDDYRCKLTTTAAGYYTFSITPQTSRNVQVSIDFPVAANDYRAVYNNAASSPTIKRPSNIIKSDQNSGTISLWLNKGTNYISFQKATLGDGGAVSWSACGSQQTVSDVPEAGIYTMTLTRNNTTYTVSTPEKYQGGLYIRTDCAPGKWADYTENRLDENTFNFKADDASTYDYYYCKWINDAGTNVRCVIANDYNVAISDTLKTEAILGGGETLPEGANVRFSYNSVTNTLKRSYLTGASTDVFLNIMPDAASTVYKTDGTTDMYNGGVVGARNKFSDLGNWVYEMDVKVYPGATASVQANYNSTQQPLIAAGTTLLGGTEENLYQIRLIYDFRTNYLMSAWMPSGTVSEAIELNSDMMIVRRAQNDANQLSFSGTGKLTDVKRAYGVFEFHKADMVDCMSTWSDFGYTYGQCMYYFSLPFDVNVSDIFGVGTMGDDWRLQFYNGTKRAEKGWFAGDGTTTFWEDVPADTVLHAYEGYCLMLNRSHFNNGSHAVWNNVTTDAYLYFPSVAPVSAVADNTMKITVPSHECKIDRFFVQDSLAYYDKDKKEWKTGARNHKYVDSHWNMMGTPLFQNATATNVAACTVKIGEADSTLTYIYQWVPSTNSLSARQVLNTDFTFKPMYAYMVQYSGDVTFSGASISSSVAARRTSENKQYTVELELTKENQFAGRTYVELRENAVDSFMLNEDMCMMKGSKIGDIYTHAGGYELAANVLSVDSHIVPVSVETKTAGTYTISMPTNFSGTVTLVDKVANTRTDLGIEDYEIYLESGTISGRFELEININNAPTAIDGVEGGTLKDGKAHKFIMNDMLYILKDGVIYDARGNRVQ